MENEKGGREMIKKLLLGLLTALLASAYCFFLILIVLSFFSLIPISISISVYIFSFTFTNPLQRQEYFYAIWKISSVAILLWIAMNPNIYKNPASLQK